MKPFLDTWDNVSFEKDINLGIDDDDIYLKLHPKIKECKLTRCLAMLYVEESILHLRQLSSENAKIEQFQEFMFGLVENCYCDCLKIMEEAYVTEHKYHLVSWDWRLHAVKLLYEWIIIDIETSDSLERVNRSLRRRIKQYCCDMRKGEDLMEMKNRST